MITLNRITDITIHEADICELKNIRKTSKSFIYKSYKTIIQKESCTTMFIAALFTRARTWKQLKCSSTEEWIKKMWYIYTMEYYPAIKENKIMSFTATWMDLEIVILSEVSQTEKDRYHMIALICGILINGTNEPIYKTEIESQM